MTAVWKLFFPNPSLPYYDDINLYLFPLRPNPRVCISFSERDRKFYEIDEKKLKRCIKKTFHYIFSFIIPHFTTRLKSLAPTMGGLHPLSTAPCQKIEALKLLILFHHTFLKSLQSWYSTSHNVIIVLHLIIKYIGMYRCIISTTAYI